MGADDEPILNLARPKEQWQQKDKASSSSASSASGVAAAVPSRSCAEATRSRGSKAVNASADTREGLRKEQETPEKVEKPTAPRKDQGSRQKKNQNGGNHISKDAHQSSPSSASKNGGNHVSNDEHQSS